MTLKPVKSLI